MILLRTISSLLLSGGELYEVGPLRHSAGANDVLEDVGSGTEVGALFNGSGEKYLWLVLASSGLFWLILLFQSSRGDNFLFKNIKILKICQKFTDLEKIVI